MRIVSQDRMIDVPYNNVMLSVFRHPKTFYICCSFNGDAKSAIFIGKYNTEERCIEVMQEIREAASGIIFNNGHIKNDDIYEIKRQLKHAPLIVKNCENVDTFNCGTYFYMPEE